MTVETGAGKNASAEELGQEVLESGNKLSSVSSIARVVIMLGEQKEAICISFLHSWLFLWLKDKFAYLGKEALGLTTTLT